MALMSPKYIFALLLICMVIVSGLEQRGDVRGDNP